MMVEVVVIALVVDVIPTVEDGTRVALLQVLDVIPTVEDGTRLASFSYLGRCFECLAQHTHTHTHTHTHIHTHTHTHTHAHTHTHTCWYARRQGVEGADSGRRGWRCGHAVAASFGGV